MFQALFYKEWIKLRLWWTLLAAANLAFALFVGLRLRHVYEFYDATVVWINWIYKGYLFFGYYETVPLLLGLVLALLQFLPEVQNFRIRLVLHLPLGETRAVALHLAAGLLLLSALLLPASAVFSLFGALYFPAEFQGCLWLTLAPWLLAGYGAYLFAAAALLESNWLNRAVLVLLGFGTLRLLLQEPLYGGYLRLLPFILLWTAGLLSLPLYSSHRYRKGLGR